jgi:uncharacterized protein YdeI (YjbR/CyaY-like superfamily)
MPTPAPRAFRSAKDFRAWLERHHASRNELIIRLYKTKHAHRGLTYREAVDEALCFGWIDGVVRRHDEISFTQRFTPRRPRSIWSRVNIKKIDALIAAGRVAPAGHAAYAKRTDERTGTYAFERAALKLSPAFLKKFKANRTAWKYYEAQPQWYRRLMVFRIMSAKRPETRERRLEGLIKHSAAGEWIPGFPPRKTKTPK